MMFCGLQYNPRCGTLQVIIHTLVHACVLSHFSRVRLFETLWTVALCPWAHASRPPTGGSLRSTWALGALLSSFGCSASISSRQGTLRSPLLRALRGAVQKEMDMVRANPHLPDQSRAVGPGPHRRPSPVSAEGKCVARPSCGAASPLEEGSDVLWAQRIP